MRLLGTLWLIVIAFGATGCFQGETDVQRLKRLLPNASPTIKVSGNVKVDGKPVKNLWVTLHPADKSQPIKPRAQTDEAGNFQIMTYVVGDGAPKGDYKITIEWLKYSVRDKDWGGPDKLKNQYNDPETSGFRVTVAEKPIELPAFELKLEGVSEKPTARKKAIPKQER